TNEPYPPDIPLAKVRRATPASVIVTTTPRNLRGVSKLFVAQLDDQQFAVLKGALDKVTVVGLPDEAFLTRRATRRVIARGIPETAQRIEPVGQLRGEPRA